MEANGEVFVYTFHTIARNLTSIAVAGRISEWDAESKHHQDTSSSEFYTGVPHAVFLGSARPLALIMMLYLACSCYYIQGSQGSSQCALGSPNTKAGQSADGSSKGEHATSSTPAALSSVDMKRSDSNYFPEDSDEDDIRKYQPRSAHSASTNTLPGRLACPYFKRSPQTYQSCQSCRGPGWRSVHHVKGHLYRRHRRQPQCSRCHLTFADTETLNDHHKMRPRCEAKEGILAEGFDHDQEKKLRSRKRKSIKSTEAERWREMYQILFPNDDPTNIPSPYYDEAYPEKPERWTNPNVTDPVIDFARYCERQLPDLVSQHLDRLSLTQHAISTSDFRTQLLEIIRINQATLLPSYRQMQADGSNPLRNVTPTPATPASTTTLINHIAANPPNTSLSMNAHPAVVLPLHQRPLPALPSALASPSPRYQHAFYPSISLPFSEDEPGLTDASKSSSSDSLETLAAACDTGVDPELMHSFDSWVMEKALRNASTLDVGDSGHLGSSEEPIGPQMDQHPPDIDMSDFLDFDVDFQHTEQELARLERGDGAPGGLFIL